MPRRPGLGLGLGMRMGMGMEEDRGTSPRLGSLETPGAAGREGGRACRGARALCSAPHQGCLRLLEGEEQEAMDSTCGPHFGPGSDVFPTTFSL